MPLVLSVSALLPASIQTPTVDVCAQGECSVAICRLSATYSASYGVHTVRPFDRVVLSVLDLWPTGVARPLIGARTALIAARLRKA